MKIAELLKNPYLSFDVTKKGYKCKVYRKKESFNFLSNLSYDFVVNKIFKENNLLYFPILKGSLKDKNLFTIVNDKLKINQLIYDLYYNLKKINKHILKTDSFDYCFVEDEIYSIYNYSNIFLKQLTKYDKDKLWKTNGKIVSFPFYLSKGSILDNYKINVESFDYKFLDFNFLGVLDLTNNQIIDKGTRIINDSFKIPIFLQCLFYQYNQKYNILDQYDLKNIPLEDVYKGNSLPTKNLLFVIYLKDNKKIISHIYIN